MSYPGPRTATIMLRRMASVVVVAAATFVANAIGGPAIAAAFDQDVYDVCSRTAASRFLAGDITPTDFSQLVNDCCFLAGGEQRGGTCKAPLGIAASPSVAPPPVVANPDVPSGSPPTKRGAKPPPTIPPIG